MPLCSGLQYADNSTGRCVDVCPDDPDTYGQLSIKMCVSECLVDEQTYAEN